MRIGPEGPRPRHATGRMEAFSDGVLAIAITLLVLDLAIPDSSASRHDLWHAVIEEWPGYLGYLVSFATIGALWLGHSAVTEYLHHVDSVFLRLNLVFLLFICLLPFVTRLLSEFITADGAEKVASAVYGVTLLVCTGLLSALWRYALAVGLVRDDIDGGEIALLTRRLTPGLGGYVVLITLGFFYPVAAVIGYLVVALFLLLPSRSDGGGERHVRATRGERPTRPRTPGT